MKEYYTDTSQNVIQKLHSNVDGLTKEESKNRLVKDGYNRIVLEKKESNIKIKDLSY